MTSAAQNLGQRLLTGGLLGFALALFLAERMSAALHELYHDEAFWRTLAGGGSPNAIADYATKVLFALILTGAWLMLWKFDAFFAPSPEKIETTCYEDKDDTPREDLPPDEDEDDETISGDETDYEEKEPSPTSKENRFAGVLGLTTDYQPEDVKAAYRTLIAQYHPDKVSRMGDEIREVAERKAKEINEAYQHFRRKYDL